MSLRFSPFLIFVAVLTCAPACFAQGVPSPLPPQPQIPVYNPALALHDVKVGEFYMKRGDTDGAIARFKDALLHKPDYAKPCLLLARAYEKKNDPTRAIHYYQRYLQIAPDAAESKKVRKRISELQNKEKQGELDSEKRNR